MYFASDIVHSRKRLRIQTVRQLWVCVLPIVLYFLFPDNRFFNNPKAVILSIVGLAVFRLVFPEKIDLVRFLEIDEANKKISVGIFNDYDGCVEKIFSFKEVTVKIKRKNWGASRRIKIISLYTGRGIFYDISESKDGFDQEVLREAAAYLEMITSPGIERQFKLKF